MKKIIAALAAIVGLGATATVVPGEWNTNFKESKAYAEANGIPLVVVWGNTGCSHCIELHETLEKSAELNAWVEEHPVILVSKHQKFSKTDADYVAARTWIEEINPEIGGFPYVGVYWKDKDGTVQSETAFTGRDGEMYVKTPKKNLAGQFVNSLDSLIGDYEPEIGSADASFVTADTEDDRLEAEPSTSVVYVPLKRENGRKPGANVLRVAYPMGAGPSIDVKWEVGELSKSVAVEMPVASFAAGQSVSLLLEGTDGTELGRSSILFVEAQENSPKNPHWVGEHTAASLPYGEWTMDFTTAKQKVALYGGKLMVMFGGPLWCPNCVAIEDYVFVTPEFKAWAKEQKLVLVHFDQGQASSPSTPEGTPRGRLLTLTPSTKGKSGASYLSRHGIEPDSDAVNEVIDRVTYLTDKWLAPESTAARLANPVVLLLNDAGTKVDARFQRQSDGYKMDLEENMCRFKDLLLLAGADENEGYRTVTPLEVEAGEDAESTLQVNASKKYYKVEGIDTGYGIEVSAEAAGNATNVTLTLYAGGDVLGSSVFLSGKGVVTVTDPLTSEQAGELYVSVTSFDNAQSTFFGPDTTFSFRVSVTAIESESAPISDFTPRQLKDMNPKLYTRRTANIPMFENVALGGKRLAGMLSVSITAANKISAKFKDAKTTSFSGAWQEISPSTGVVTAELLNRNGAELNLTMDAAGTIEANYSSKDGLVAAGRAGIGDMSAYVGRYTVTLVDTEESCGTGYLTVNVSKNGKASVSGVMPDGTTVSASAELSANGDATAMIPVYSSSRKGTLSVVLVMDADAASTWGDKGSTDTIRSLTGCPATWTTGEETVFNVFGGYWKSGATPLAVCNLYGLSDELDVVIGGNTNDVVTATKSGFKVTKDVLTSLSFNKSTGVFSGKAKMTNSLGKSVTATVKGVLLPGWISCGECGEEGVNRPYGSGTVYYKDGKAIVSKPIDLVAEEL